MGVEEAVEAARAAKTAGGSVAVSSQPQALVGEVAVAAAAREAVGQAVVAGGKGEAAPRAVAANNLRVAQAAEVEVAAAAAMAARWVARSEAAERMAVAASKRGARVVREGGSQVEQSAAVAVSMAAEGSSPEPVQAEVAAVDMREQVVAHAEPVAMGCIRGTHHRRRNRI